MPPLHGKVEIRKSSSLHFSEAVSFTSTYARQNLQIGHKNEVPGFLMWLQMKKNHSNVAAEVLQAATQCYTATLTFSRSTFHFIGRCSCDTLTSRGTMVSRGTVTTRGMMASPDTKFPQSRAKKIVPPCGMRSRDTATTQCPDSDFPAKFSGEIVPLKLSGHGALGTQMRSLAKPRRQRD